MGAESDSFPFPQIRPRLVVVLKSDARPNGVPLETMSARARRSGGTKTVFHAGFGLLEVEEWGRWKSSSFHEYLLYDMQSTRRAGERWLFRLVFWISLKPDR